MELPLLYVQYVQQESEPSREWDANEVQCIRYSATRYEPAEDFVGDEPTDDRAEENYLDERVIIQKSAYYVETAYGSPHKSIEWDI